MTEGGGAEYGTQTKPTKHIGGWGCWANARMFNGQLPEGDRNDIADNHYHPDGGTPF